MSSWVDFGASGQLENHKRAPSQETILHFELLKFLFNSSTQGYETKGLITVNYIFWFSETWSSLPFHDVKKSCVLQREWENILQND